MAEMSGAPVFSSLSFAVADQMSQALLLGDAFQFRDVVTAAPITDHDAVEIGGDRFPHFLIAMARPYLIDRKPRVGALQKSAE
jgi:hypothetical protein